LLSYDEGRNMAWLARIMLFVPALIAGWFVSKEDPRYWVVAMVIALVFIALSCCIAIYVPAFRLWPRRTRQ
jgi:NhaP-type Na+/H+ and K+/H+ antiporter